MSKKRGKRDRSKKIGGRQDSQRSFNTFITMKETGYARIFEQTEEMKEAGVILVDQQTLK